jgi:glycosyltransferase involved in cell wall biosynthesis
LILDRTPAYFPGERDWFGYTSATALSLVAADEVAFFSEHARQEAIRDGLVDIAKTSVVAPGTDHFAGGSETEARPAAMSAIRMDEPFILVLGNAYFHKNRVFALRVAEELRRKHAWNGTLVFVGGRPVDGSSALDEARFLSDHPQLQARFVGIGRVTDDEQRWLYRYAALVLYPSLYEGFGLIPFEAAAAGTPCLYSSRSSVAEFLPTDGALILLTDAAITATRIAAVLHDADTGSAIVRAIQAAGKPLTWERAAASYAGIYRRAIERPVGLALAMRGDVVIGGRSELALDDTERRVLFVLRRIGAARLVARGLLGAAAALYRVVRR